MVEARLVPLPVREVGHRDLCRLYVSGNVNKHRSLSSGAGYVEGFMQDARQIFYIFDYIVVLCDRHGYVRDIELLEAVSSDLGCRDVAGYRDEREESRQAVAIPVTRLAAPGPLVARTTPTFPVALA